MGGAAGEQGPIGAELGLVGAQAGGAVALGVDRRLDEGDMAAQPGVLDRRLEHLEDPRGERAVFLAEGEELGEDHVLAAERSEGQGVAVLVHERDGRFGEGLVDGGAERRGRRRGFRRAASDKEPADDAGDGDHGDNGQTQTSPGAE